MHSSFLFTLGFFAAIQYADSFLCAEVLASYVSIINFSGMTLPSTHVG